MKNVVAYIKNEDAIDEFVGKILMILVAVGLALAVGWWVYNTTKTQTDSAKCDGNASPFCIE